MGGSDTPTVVPGQDCGAVSALFGGNSDSLTPTPGTSVPKPMACFLAAYASCTSATLEFTEHGVDTGVTHTFSLARSPTGNCAVADDVYSYSANFGGSRGPVQHYVCGGVLAQGDSLIVEGCGAEGNITIPATAIVFPATATPTA